MYILRHNTMKKPSMMMIKIMSLASVLVPNILYASDVTNSDVLDDYKNEALTEQMLEEDVSKNSMSEAESIEYLKQDQKLFEQLLGTLLMKEQSIQLKKLLPEYQTLPEHDQSVIDWGEAIVLVNEGQYKKAITIYKKINAALPDLQIIRLQMARALMLDGQYHAAQSELESLRADTINENDIKVINQYLSYINEQDTWDFNGSISYVNDNNLTNAPEEGTQLITDNGVTTYNSEHEEGEGLDFNFSADKNWMFDNKAFVSTGVSTYGNYYWDNDNFNDVSAKVSLGTGYKSKDADIEISHSYSQRWFAGGYGLDSELDRYSQTQGIDLVLGKWLAPNILYRGYAGFDNVTHIEKYDTNDANIFSQSNSLIYFPNAKTHVRFGVNYAQKDAENKTNSNIRKGINVGVNRIWDKGFATNLSFGYSQTDYDNTDFFGIKKVNNQFNTGLSIWNRQYEILGLTPKIHLNYVKVTSNSPFEEYEKSNAFLKLTKTF